MAEDSTEVDPDGHRIAFENDRVRILEVKQPSGGHIPMHAHPPRAVISVGEYRLKSVDAEGNVHIIDRRPGEVSWSDGEEHEAWVLTGTVHAIEVEVKP